jgi:hypothetical protein
MLTTEKGDRYSTGSHGALTLELLAALPTIVDMSLPYEA